MSRQPLADAASAFNPLAPQFLADPYKVYAALRQVAPVFQTPLKQWVLTRHADVHFVLTDPRFEIDYVQSIGQFYGPAALDEPAIACLSKMTLLVDPPNHTRFKLLVAKTFSSMSFGDLRTRVAGTIDDLIRRLRPQGSMDVIREFAFPLPLTVISDMLGIPPSDQPRLFEHFRVTNRLIDPAPMSREEMDAANQLIQKFEDYFESLIHLRRRKPGDDLTSRMLALNDDAGLNDRELVANLLMLFLAGHETTINLIGNGLLVLFGNPSQFAAVRAEHGLLGRAINEILRLEGPVQFTGRVAKTRVEIGGQAIEPGEFIMACLGAANRDPSVFPQPDQMLLDREHSGMLSFGAGIHHCLGARLGRLEAELAFSALMSQLPAMELRVPLAPQWRPNFTFRGLQKLEVAW